VLTSSRKRTLAKGKSIVTHSSFGPRAVDPWAAGVDYPSAQLDPKWKAIIDEVRATMPARISSRPA